MAWAIGDPRARWWPFEATDVTAAGYYWPEHLPTGETVEAFEALFRALGFESTPNGALEDGYEKIALYTDAAGTPTHVAWQTARGIWASKVGAMGNDCLHDRPEDANSDAYGHVRSFYRRLRTRWEMPRDPVEAGVIVDVTAPLGTVVVR